MSATDDVLKLDVCRKKKVLGRYEGRNQKGKKVRSQGGRKVDEKLQECPALLRMGGGIFCFGYFTVCQLSSVEQVAGLIYADSCGRLRAVGVDT